MYEVLDCDNTVRCETLEEACRVAEGWFPENWDVRLDPADCLESLNARLLTAYGQGDCPDAGCPEIVEVGDEGNE